VVVCDRESLIGSSEACYQRSRNRFVIGNRDRCRSCGWTPSVGRKFGGGTFVKAFDGTTSPAGPQRP
jgi:hypothetical protein